MFIVSIIISGIVIGYLANTIKKRFPAWVFMLAAFLGALVGGFLSFGDSALMLAYPIFNIWTVSVLGALLFSAVAIFADRGKMLPTAITILIILVAIFGLLYSDSTQTNLALLFSEELQRAGVERVGQPIEGFSAFIYLDAFPGFEESDFDGVRSLEGIYKIVSGELKYERTVANPVTSAEDVISEAGYKTLLKNFSERVGVDVATEANIATLLEKLREGDEVKVSYITDDFSIWYPEGWYPYENSTGVLFVRDENLEMPKNTEGYALGPQFRVIMQTTNKEELFAQSLWNEGSEFLITKELVRIRAQEATRVVTKAAGAGGEDLHYVFESTDGRVFVLSHYPYERGSSDTDDFERAVQTFMINYAKFLKVNK